MEYHLMTMPHNGIDPHYHGVVDIDANNIITSTGTPVEDFGCFYFSVDPFPTDAESMFNKFLSLIDD